MDKILIKSDVITVCFTTFSLFSLNATVINSYLTVFISILTIIWLIIRIIDSIKKVFNNKNLKELNEE